VQFLFLFLIIFSILGSTIFFENSFSQQSTPPHHQWKKSVDPDVIICKENHLLLQKHDGSPACVMPSTYMKLIDRGYGNYDSSIMSKRPEMMTQLMHHMVSDEKLMHHWHEMMQKNPNVMSQTTNDWVSQIKENPQLLKNMLSPMTSDPTLREKMIQTMKNHSQMENSLKQHSKWMDSVHQKMMGSDMGQGMHNTVCAWCSDYQMPSSHDHSMGIANSDRLMNMIHEMWVNSGMRHDMHKLMLQNPSHIAQMSEQMMEQMLGKVMDDKVLRQQMINLMLEHNDFMNTIRHDNPTQEH